jgi:hypothetical protein
MSCSMENYLKIVTPYLHPDLVSPEALSHIQPLAQILPPTSVGGFECRLGATQSRVDLQVSIPRLTLNLPQRFLTHPVWQFFQELCQEWSDPTSFLYQGVERIWMEFDLDGEQFSLPIPCIFLLFNQKIVMDAQSLIETTSRLLNYQVSPPIESNLRRCADFLPAGAKISHLGAMLSRRAHGVRLNVEGISPLQLPDYLVQIGWSDPSNTLSTLVSNLSEFVDYIYLSFDVSDTILPRIGLECYLHKPPTHELKWQLFLDYLVEKELCTSAKKDALLCWYGFTKKSSVANLWPSNISVCDRLFGSGAKSVFWRRLSHIKLVYQPGIPLEAKGYLGFGHSWVKNNTLPTKQEQPKNEKDELSFEKSDPRNRNLFSSTIMRDGARNPVSL